VMMVHRMVKGVPQIAEEMKDFGFVREGMLFQLLFVNYVAMVKEKLMKLVMTN